MAHQTDHVPNPRRVAAGKANQRKWKGHTEAGLLRLREAALRIKPWLQATGPRTAEGKARAALNGKARQKGEYSRHERRQLASDALQLMELMALTRRHLVLDQVVGQPPGSPLTEASLPTDAFRGF